jgi:16S rRNA (uracil1498-N3)-methyltransferase
MALRRFYVEPEALSETGVLIRGDLFHHIREVCRFRAGDQFEVLPGNGEAWLVEVEAQTNHELSARLLAKRALPELAKPYLTIALSVPKLPKVDWIVEKSVELGVYEIHPFVSDYSFLRSVKEISANRVQRWQKLVQAATQQSGRGDLMKLANATTLENLLLEFNQSPKTGGLFPYEGETRVGLPAAIQDLKTKDLDHVWAFVGSEGGFSPREVELFASYGLNPVSMGEQILRVETACLALASVIKYELGALG